MSHTLLTHVQKELCRFYQKEISETVRDAPIVKDYCKRYDDYFKRCEFTPVEESKLENAIHNARIVLFSDYHSLKADKKQFLKYIKKVGEQGQKPVVALECFNQKNQKCINAFLHDEITEEEFLKKTNFKKWGFDWQLYKPIFEYAKTRGLRIAGINYLTNNMHQRDKIVANRISEIAKLEEKVFVLFGESHLLRTRIPRYIKTNKNKVVVHQNPIELYWRLAKCKKEREKILQLENNEYALNTVPPVLKLQSFINSIEGKTELDYGNGTDIGYQIFSVAKNIGKVLGIKVLNKWFDSLNICTPLDNAFLQTILENENEYLKKENLEFLKEQLSRGQSCFISGRNNNIIVLGNLSLDEAAEEVTHFIHRMSSGYTNGLSGPDAFYAYCIYEALGFLGSKIVNPNREFNEREYQKVFEEAKGNQKLFVSYHLLGYHLGERLYKALVNEQPGIKEAVAKAFKTNLNKRDKAKEVYFELIKLTR